MKRTLSKSKFYLLVLSIVLIVGLIPLAYFAIALPQISIEDGSHHSAVADKTSAEDELTGDNADQALSDSSAESGTADTSNATQEGTDAQEGATDTDSKADDSSKESTDSSKEATDTTGDISKQEETQAKDSEAEATNESNPNSETDSATTNASVGALSASGVEWNIIKKGAKECIKGIKLELDEKPTQAITLGEEGKDSNYFIDEWTFAHYNPATGEKSKNWNVEIKTWITIKGNVTLALKDGMEISINKEDSQSHDQPAIWVSGDNSFTLTSGVEKESGEWPIGSAKLYCYGGGHSAGIGGKGANKLKKHDSEGCNITIDDCVVQAYGSYDPLNKNNSDTGGAGIGGSWGGTGHHITINGGYVYATSHYGGAGIGSGYGAGDDSKLHDDNWYQNNEETGEYEDSGGYNIEINGGSVVAKGCQDHGYRSAAIGGGYASDGHDIRINGGEVEAIGGYSSAAIGGGDDEDAWADAPHGYNIKISGNSKVKATGGDNGGAGIGSGNGWHAWGILIDQYANVEAQPGYKAAGIGGGSGGKGCYIEICGNAVVRVDPCDKVEGQESRCTGIGGGGSDCDGSYIKIHDEAYVSATGRDGAGIGGGYGGGDADNITVEGKAQVYAYNVGNEGAAIGAGQGGELNEYFTVKDSSDQHPYVFAKADGSNSPGIGNCKCDKKTGDNTVDIAHSLTVCDKDTGKWLTGDGHGPSGNWGWQDIRNIHTIEVNNGPAGDAKISVSRESDFPTVGYESSVEYQISAEHMDLATDGLSICWYKDAAGTESASAPSYLDDTGRKGNSAYPVACLKTCPDLTKEAYGITPAGTYYFRIESNHSGTTVKSEVQTYTINKAKVNIKTNSATKIYDGTPLTCEEFSQNVIVVAEKTSASTGSEPFTKYDTVVESCSGYPSQTEVGWTSNTPNKIVFKSPYIADNYDLVVEAGTLTVNEGYLTIRGNNYLGTYDGQTHEFDYKVVIRDGIVVEPDKINFKTSTDGVKWSDWTSTVPSIKDAGTLYVKTQGELESHVTTEESDAAAYTMKVVKANVGIVSASAEKEYDSTLLKRSNLLTDITFSGYGFAEGEGVKITFDGSTQTYVGSTPNKFSYDWKEGTDPNNYEITKTEGTLTVTKNTKPITIYTGSARKMYDGTPLSCDTCGWTRDIVGQNDQMEVVVGGTITDAGSKVNSVDSYVIKNKHDGTDATDCYTFAQSKCGMLTVEQRNVDLTSRSAIWVYDGNPHTCETVDVGGDGLIEGDELEYTNFAIVTRADEGIVDNTFDYYFKDETNTRKGNNYKFTVNYGKLKIVEKLGVIGADVSCYYDGISHSAPATVVGALSYDLTYQTSTDGSSWSAWTADVPARTDAGITFIKARAVTSTGTESCEYTLTVKKRPVTISTGSASQQYNGTALTCNESTISGMGFVDGQGATVKITGTQTDMGESDNTFTYTLNTGTSADNYEITESPGKLTVTKNMSPVNITTGSDSQAYNGLPLTNSDFTYEGTIFEGDTLVVAPNGSITDVGSTQNTVSAYQVVRADGKVITDYYTFANVVYGTLTVSPRHVVLETESAEKVYDGTALTDNIYKFGGDGFIEGEGATVEFTGTQTKAGSSTNKATYTLNPGTQEKNYTITTKFGTLTVDKRQVTLASGSSIAFAKDVSAENPLTNSDCSVAGLGFVDNEVVEGYPKGVGKNTGLTEGQEKSIELNFIEIKWQGAGSPDNYDINAILGRLVVVKDDASEAVATGYTGVYDGQAHGGQVASTLSEASKKYSTDKQHWQTDPITRTDAGETTVYVEITGKDTHEASVTLKTDYKLTITERPVILTAGSDSKVYDGTALTCDDVIVGGSGFAYNESKGKSEKPSTLSTEGSLTDVKIDPDTGEILSETNKVVGYDTAEEEVGYNPNNYNITPVNGSLTVNKRTAVLLSKSLGVPGSSQDTIVYDGKKHEVKEVTEVGKGTEKKIPNIGFVEGEGATYDGFEQYTHAGAYRNIFEYHLNTLTTKDTNYNIKQCYGVIKITPRGVDLVSADAQKMYDETPLTCDTVYENGQGFVSGEGAIYDVTGSQTQVGQSENTFTYTLKDNTLAADYDISTDYGILQVYTANTLRIVTPQNQVFDYDGKRHGDCAYAYIGEEPETSVQLFYSLDGGKTWTTGPAKTAAIGVTNVIVHADKEGYEQASANYNITINAVPGDPYVYQEDLDKIAEQYKDLGTTVFARAAIDMDTTADPADLAKLQAAEPGKNLKYDNVRLLLTALDDNDQPVTKGGITYDDYDIGDVNNVIVRIAYKANTNEIKDLNCLRVHKGELNYLPQVDTCGTTDESWAVDKQNGTVTIGAKKYSTYALAYNNIESVQGFLSGSTGDSVPLAMVVIALAAVGVGITMLSSKLRRRRVR